MQQKATGQTRTQATTFGPWCILVPAHSLSYTGAQFLNFVLIIMCFDKDISYDLCKWLVQEM